MLHGELAQLLSPQHSGLRGTNFKGKQRYLGTEGWVPNLREPVRQRIEKTFLLQITTPQKHV